MLWEKKNPPRCVLPHDEKFAACSDARLVDRFVLDHSEKAFEILVDRHGAGVLNVCLANSDDRQAAEDAFQITFLVLARKARSLDVKESLGPWLRGVARRVATTSRTSERRRKNREARYLSLRTQSKAIDSNDNELNHRIHQEIDRLPERFRAVMRHCDVDGLSHDEAAERLSIPVGTIKSRLSRARAKLKDRLVRGGLAPTAIVATSITRTAPAAVPRSLQTLVTQKALALVSGSPVTGMVPVTSNLFLVGIKTMMMSKFFMTLSGLAIGLGTIGVSATTFPGTSGRPKTEIPNTKEEPSTDPANSNSDSLQGARTDADKPDNASNWNVEITYPGQAKQKAYIRVRNGVIYPHAKVNNNPSGKAYIDDDGYMHIVFDGHPKVVAGEAVLEKVANGKWAGVLTQASGESHIELKRD